MQKTISAANISPANFRIGDVIDGMDNNQYRIADITEDGTNAVIEKLGDDERIKFQYLNGQIKRRAR